MACYIIPGSPNIAYLQQLLLSNSQSNYVHPGLTPLCSQLSTSFSPSPPAALPSSFHATSLSPNYQTANLLNQRYRSVYDSNVSILGQSAASIYGLPVTTIPYASAPSAPANGSGIRYNRKRRISGRCEQEADRKYALRCDMCRVSLNAQLQARQHFEGKSHARRSKLNGKFSDEKQTSPDEMKSLSASLNLSDNASETIETDDELLNRTSPTCSSTTASTTTSISSSIESSTTSSTTSSTISSCIINTTIGQVADEEAYCKYCGVSFNSWKQARQHYGGRAHAKKVRQDTRHQFPHLSQRFRIPPTVIVMPASIRLKELEDKRRNERRKVSRYTHYAARISEYLESDEEEINSVKNSESSESLDQSDEADNLVIGNNCFDVLTNFVSESVDTFITDDIYDELSDFTT